jgi:hypothetical protein
MPRLPLAGTTAVTAEAMTHLDADTVAAYVDGRLGPQERSGVESHLAFCVVCRDEVVSVRQMLASFQPVARRFPMPRQLAAAAALILAVGLPLAGKWGGTSDEVPVRQPGSATVSAVVAVEPAADAALAGGPVRFVWRAADPGSTFRVRIVDEAGSTVWSVETGDTVASLPGEVTLRPGAAYYWYVDALAADGRSMTSGAQRFTVR